MDISAKEEIAKAKSVKKTETLSAQNILENLCQSHGLKSWSIDGKKGNWKELVLRICGVMQEEPSKKVGRPKHSQETIRKYGQRIEALYAFSIKKDGTKYFARNF